MKSERTAEKIRETRYLIFSQQSGKCFSCGEPMGFLSFELAHVIPNRKWTVKLYGEAVINNVMNLRGTHAGKCNSRAQINPDSLQAEELAQSIQRQLKRTSEKAWRSALAVPKRIRG